MVVNVGDGLHLSQQPQQDPADAFGQQRLGHQLLLLGGHAFSGHNKGDPEPPCVSHVSCSSLDAASNAGSAW